MDTQDFFDLKEEFLSIARANLAPDDEEAFFDEIEEARWQVNDWYNACSYYPKPEDILEDYFFVTPEQAKRFLSLFKGESF